MQVHIGHLIEGAEQATGLTVIIDVFRAFSLECYLYAMGAREIRPVGTVEEAFAWRRKDPSCLLVGERQGRKCEGFDFGNSPSSVTPGAVRGKRIIHTTSAGTQGIVHARNAERILTGSLVNAAAVAELIRAESPEDVSLVCMGTGGVVRNPEDELCAEYLRSLILGLPAEGIGQKVRDLRFRGGEHFFDPRNQEVFPEEDFWMCIERDRFGFVLEIEKDGEGYLSRKREPGPRRRDP